VTQRISGILLTFDQPIREDDVQHLMLVFGQLNGVADVRVVESEPTAEFLARARRDREWMEKIGDAQDAMLGMGKYRGQ
jgi:GTP cyclohydrolase II